MNNIHRPQLFLGCGPCSRLVEALFDKISRLVIKPIIPRGRPIHGLLGASADFLISVHIFKERIRRNLVDSVLLLFELALEFRDLVVRRSFRWLEAINLSTVYAGLGGFLLFGLGLGCFVSTFHVVRDGSRCRAACHATDSGPDRATDPGPNRPTEKASNDAA